MNNKKIIIPTICLLTLLIPTSFLIITKSVNSPDSSINKNNNTDSLLEDENTTNKRKPLKITWNPYSYEPNATNIEYRNQFVDAILNYQTKLTLPNKEITEEAYIGVLFEFLPAKLVYTDVDYDTNTITIEYRYPEEEHYKKIEDFKNKVESIISEICYEDDDDLAKVLAVHKYLSTNVQYYHDEGTEDYFDNINGFSAITKNSAICSGYAEAYSHLLQQLGIESHIVNGETTKVSGPDTYSHAWNLVKINDKYYHCDATWENSYSLGAGLSRFGLTTKEMKLDFPSKWRLTGVNNENLKVPDANDKLFIPARNCDSWEYDSNNKTLKFNIGQDTNEININP